MLTSLRKEPNKMKQLILFVAVLIWLLICAITIPSSASSVQRAALSPAANQAPREAKAKAAPEQYSPLLRGVDHFFAYSSEPETLFKFFRDTLGLPQDRKSVV